MYIFRILAVANQSDRSLSALLNVCAIFVGVKLITPLFRVREADE